MTAKYFFPLLIAIILFSCKKDKPVIEPWLIQQDEVLDGGPGKDGIPSIDNPQFIDVNSASYILPSDLVVGYYDGKNAKAYPYKILNWHEIINDELNGVYFSIIYCPLTGSVTCWDRTINNSVTEFGVSGLIYNTNVIPYDRTTGSNWSQLGFLCVNGELMGQKPKNIQVLETTWNTWRKLFPNSQILSDNTGFDRDYDAYPYGDYKTSDNTLFPLSSKNNLFPIKEKVFGVVEKKYTKIYPMSEFKNEITIINTTFLDENIIVVGSAKDNFTISFKNAVNDNAVVFTAIQDSLPTIMKDDLGNRWDVLGYAVSGPNKGEKLAFNKSIKGYWLAYPPFFPEIKE